MTSAAGEQFVIRPVTRAEMPLLADLQYEAFNDATNATPDEVSHLLYTDVDASTGRVATREEVGSQITSDNLQLFSKPGYHFIGIYDSSTLAGYAIWHAIRASDPPESRESDEKQREQPSFFNRFFGQINRTRDHHMQGKAYWYLKLLIIDPRYQRKGLGSRLVNWGLERAQKDGTAAWLESSPMGKGAYLKLGFRVVGMDRLEETRAKRGFVEWPYMIHDPSGQAS